METIEVTSALQNCAQRNDCHGCPEDLGVESCKWIQLYGKCLFAIAAEVITRKTSDYNDAIVAIEALDASNDSLMKESELLHKTIRDLSGKIAYWQAQHTDAQLDYLILDDMIPRWTSVSDGLPKQDGFYEVRVKDCYANVGRYKKKPKPIRIYEYCPCNGFVNDNLWIGEDGCYIKNVSVTHWRPCPELPENEREEKQ